MQWKTLMPVLLCVAGLHAEPPAKTLTELKAFYVAYCARCHGYDGSPPQEEGKKPKGLDFTDPANVAKASDTRMVKAIRKGIFFGLVMPPYKKRLSEADTQLMVTEILRKAEKGKAIAP